MGNLPDVEHPLRESNSDGCLRRLLGKRIVRTVSVRPRHDEFALILLFLWIFTRQELSLTELFAPRPSF